MIDPVQAVLLFVIVLLTLLLLVLGVQVFLILKELRSVLTKANKVLDTTEMITESVTEPMSIVSAMILGTKTISKLFKSKSRE